MWILHPKRDGRVVALGRTRGHNKISLGVNKNGKQCHQCVLPQQIVEVLQLVMHGEPAMYLEEDGSIKTIDKAMHAYYKDETKLK